MSFAESCNLCAQEDLGTLFDDPPAPEAGFSLSEYEEKCTIWLQRNFQEVVTPPLQQSFSCPLCKLIRECAHRAQLWKTDEFACSIRPVFAWRSPRPEIGDGSKDATPRPRYSGEWHVWFYEVKLERKLGRLANEPDIPDSPTQLAQPDLSDSRRTQPTKSGLHDFGWVLSPFRRSKNDEVINEPVSEHIADLMSRDSTGLSSDSPGRLRLKRRTDGILRTFVPVNKAIASWTVEAVQPDDLDAHYSIAREAYRVPIRQTIDFGLARRWIEECDTEHGHNSSRAFAQQRLKNAFASRTMRAINTRTRMISLLPFDAKYVALSYVWGTIVTPKADLARASYPPAIKDALTITQKLGFEWLWVDRLCINQDDEAEKFALVPVIKDIFALAEITIVAAAGKGAHDRLPGVNVERNIEEDPIALYGETATLSLLPAPYSFNRLLEPCSWRKRGWTFEEHVFSRRLLYVFDTEVIFSCSSGTYREAHGMKLREGSAGSTWGDHGSKLPTIEGLLHAKFNTDRSETNRRISCSEFVKAVKEYSRRQLTFEEDRINAFAGLVTAPMSASDPLEETSVLLHGHPLTFFETLLSWHGDEGWHDRDSTVSERIAPSWSWAAVGGKVDFHDDGEEHSRCCWFKFTLYEGFDVLGLPVETDIPIVSELALGSCRTLIESVLPDSGLLPTYSTAIHQDSSATPSRLPRLHLVTVTFKGVILLADEGQHYLLPVPAAGRPHSDARYLGYWNIKNTKFPSKATICTFAIVGGNSRMYIMLLLACSIPGVFKRGGLLRVPLGPFSTSSARALKSIMLQGQAKWEHIVIA